MERRLILNFISRRLTKMKKNFTILILLITILCKTLLSSVNTLLDMIIPSRILSMGAVSSAISKDVGSVVLNPAGIAELTHLGILFDYKVHYFDVKNYFLCVGSKIKGFYLTGGIGNRTVDNIQKVVENTLIGEFSYNDGIVILGVGKNFLDKFYFGVSGKFIYQVVETLYNCGMGVDLGIIAKMEKFLNIPVTFSTSLLNTVSIFSNQESFMEESLPFMLKIGCCVNLKKVNIAFDVGYSPYEYDSDVWSISLGTEYNVVSNILTLRAGINENGLIDEILFIDKISFGGSVRLTKMLYFDYALVYTRSFNEYSHSFSLRFDRKNF